MTKRLRNIIEAIAVLGLIAAVIIYAPSWAKAADKAGSPAMGEAATAFAPAKSRFAGCYGGIGLGVGSAATETGIIGEIAANGAVASVLAGCNADIPGSALIVGAEADASLAAVKGSSTPLGVAIETSGKWTASLRARLGMAWGAVMPFVTGGWAIGYDELKVPALSLSDSSRRQGWVYGAGLEGQLTKTIGARVEVLHYDWQDKDLNLGGVTVPDVDRSETVGRAAIIMQLN